MTTADKLRMTASDKAGMTVPETAEALGVSVSTVNRNWNAGKVWLYREIGEDELG